MSKTITGQGLIRPLPEISYSLLRGLGVLSVLAGLGCVIADLIMQYDPQGNYSMAAPVPLTIAPERVLIGSWLGVCCIPLEIAGYWLVCTILAEVVPKLARYLFWVIAYAIVLGTVFHGSVLALFLVERAAHTATGSVLSVFLQIQNILYTFILPLSFFFELCYLIIWCIFAVIIVRNRTQYPKWSVLCIPALSSLFIAAIGASHILPVLGNILYPTVSSLPHFIFFLVTTVLLWKEGSKG